jgi:threonine/homoserine/homoserine lactone efflux protein
VETLVWLKGLLLGFSIAAPVGPIGVLCIRRTIANGRLNGLVTGLGAATADAFYGWIAAFGLTFIADFLVSQQAWFRFIGGLFLLYLGVKTWRARPADQAAEADRRSLGGAYLSTLLLTLTNPATILSFIAIFAGLGVASGTSSYSAASALVLGVFCGSALWWLMLSTIVSLLRERLTPRALGWINLLSGVLIAGFGLVALFSLLGYA